VILKVIKVGDSRPMNGGGAGWHVQEGAQLEAP
jgi:hypothetical protein